MYPLRLVFYVFADIYSLFRMGRMGATNRILSTSVGSLSPMKGFPPASIDQPRLLSENSDPARRAPCCPQCTHRYAQELAKLVAKESETSSSETEAAQPLLPQWLQHAKAHDVHSSTLDQTQVSLAQIDLKGLVLLLFLSHIDF